MSYVQDRIIHDADAHVMETPEWIEAFAPKRVNDYLLEHFSIGAPEIAFREIEAARALHADTTYRAADEAEILLRKNWRATGSFDPRDRTRALDLLGLTSDERLALARVRLMPPGSTKGDTPLRALLEGLAQCAVAEAYRSTLSSQISERTERRPVTSSTSQLISSAAPWFWYPVCGQAAWHSKSSRPGPWSQSSSVMKGMNGCNSR